MDDAAIRRPFIGGNWKMNTTLAGAVELVEGLLAAADASSRGADIVIFPPFPYLQAVGRAVGHHAVMVGAQNFWPSRNGPFTGEVGLEMLEDLGVRWALVGHSERREHCREDDALVARKVQAGLEAGLSVVLCVGESLVQRDAGDAEAVVSDQVDAALEGVPMARSAQLVVAYEPVWAIGTGRTAAPSDARDAHAAIRRTLARRYDDAFAQAVRIIYGGSMNAGNAPGLLAEPDVDGGLIGGASLSADSFAAVCAASVNTA